MKQLYHTSCKSGLSLNGKSGYQIRAVTDGVPEPRARALSSQAGYELPVLNLAPEDFLKVAPIRLAFTPTQAGERLIVHSVYVGRDPETCRTGNFFSHLLFDISEDVTARQVIDSWRSPEWKIADDDTIPVKLPEIDNVPVGAVNEEQLVAFLRAPENFELCCRFLNAWLTSEPDARFCLAAPAESVICCLDALTRVLPQELVSDLTFSTYEHRPTTSFAKVIGTWFGPAIDSNRDLSETWYRGRNFGINFWLENKCSERPQFVVARGLLQMLAAGDFSAVNEFLADLPGECRTDATLFDLAWRTLEEPDLLSAADLPSLNRVPELRRTLFDSDDRLRLLVNAAVRDPESNGPVFRSLATDTPSRCDRLTSVIEREWRKRLEAADLSSVREFLEGFAFRLPPVLSTRFQWWDTIPSPGPDPECLPTDLHLYLLPHMLNEGCLSSHHRERRTSWLTVPPERFEVFSSLKLRDEVLLEIALNSIGPASFEVLVKFVTERPHLLPSIMLRLDETFAPEHFVNLFNEAVENCGSAISVLDILLQIHDRIDKGILNDCLKLSLERNQVSIDDLARSRMGDYLSAELKNHCVKALVEDVRSGRVSPDESLLGFLEKACAADQLEPAIQEATSSLLAQLNAVREFFAHPRFADEHSTLDDGRDKRALESTIASLRSIPAAELQRTAIRLFDHVLVSLGQTTARHQLTTCFLVFDALEEVINTDPLYDRLILRIRNARSSQPPLGLIASVVIRGFGSDRRFDRSSAASLVRFLSDTSVNVPKWLDAHSRDWPQDVRDEWIRFRHAMAPVHSREESPRQPPAADPVATESVGARGGLRSVLGRLFGSPQSDKRTGSDDRSGLWYQRRSQSDTHEPPLMSHRKEPLGVHPETSARDSSQDINMGVAVVRRLGFAQRLNSTVQHLFHRLSEFVRTVVDIVLKLLLTVLILFALFVLLQLSYGW